MPSPRISVPPYVARVRVRLGASLMQGSGLVIGPRLILTCAHVIADVDPDNGERPLRTSFEEPVPSGWPVIQRGAEVEVLAGLQCRPNLDRRRARYLAEDTTNDLALLEVDRPFHGVAPPLIGRHRQPDGTRRVAFGSQNDRFRRCELRSEAGILHFIEDEEMPHAVEHQGGMPGGFSGAPKIAIDERGRHWLEGICAVGGLASPTGLDAGPGAIVAFLEKELPGWRLPDISEVSERPPPPGVADEFELDLPGADPIRLRWIGERAAFRAARPLSAETLRRLRGEPHRTGSGRLAAHLPDADEARTCLARLAEASGAQLRLPTVAELNALGEGEVGEPPTSPTGGFVTLAAFDAWESLAPLPDTAEWARDRNGDTCCVLRRQAGEPVARLATGPSGADGHPHLRFALRPVFEPS